MNDEYRMRLVIKDWNRDKTDAIIDAAAKKWDFDDSYDDINDDTLNMEGLDTLNDIMDEEFADEIAKAIWEANGGYCSVNVMAIHLEEKVLARNEDAFKRLTGVS